MVNPNLARFSCSYWLSCSYAAACFHAAEVQKEFSKAITLCEIRCISKLNRVLLWTLWPLFGPAPYFDIQPSEPSVTMLLLPVSCTLIALSLSASDMLFASSLIFFPTEMVGVCKFNPPLVSSCQRPPQSVLLLLLLWTFSLPSCRSAQPVQLPSCLSVWPVLHH